MHPSTKNLHICMITSTENPPLHSQIKNINPIYQNMTPSTISTTETIINMTNMKNMID